MSELLEPPSHSRRRFLTGGLVLGGAVLLGPTLRPPVASAMLRDPYADHHEPIFEERGGRPPSPTARLSAKRVAPPPPIVSRAEWGADESIVNGEPSYAPVQKFVVHHSASGNNPADPAATVRAIQQYHVRERGFFDIAYNYLIDQHGRIYEGRRARTYGSGEVPSSRLPDGRGVVGAHTYNHNTGSMGFCLLGDFTSTTPSQAAVEALVSVLAWQMSVSGVQPLGNDVFTNYAGVTATFPNITGHRDLTATGCPGDRLYTIVPTVRSKTDALVNSGVIGYWVLGRDGNPNPVGAAAALGGLPSRGLDAASSGMAVTPSRQGYWVLDYLGGPHPFGDAPYVGSLAERGLRALTPSLAATPTGRGLWVLDELGGVHAFGDADYLGSLPERGIVGKVSDIAATPSGNGYWILDQVGGVHAFGDATEAGSFLTRGVSAWGVDIESSPSGKGYTVLDHAGGIHVFGDAPYHGSAFGKLAGQGAAGLLVESTGRGYHVLGADGRVLAFGGLAELGGASVVTPAAGIAGA